jgi:hypothetical protein
VTQRELKPTGGADPPHFFLSSAGAGLYDVTFEGRFRLGWFGRLCAALSVRNISVENGSAERDQDGTWTGHLQIRPLAGASEVEALHWAELCEEQTLGLPPLVDLGVLRVFVERRGKRAIELHLAAKDQLGFLSALLGRFGFLGLFPERIHVSTRGSSIDDVFVLSSLAGEISDSLEAKLIGVLRRTEGGSTAPPSAKTPPSGPRKSDES